MADLDTSGLIPLDTTGLVPVEPQLDTSGLIPLDTSGLIPVEDDADRPRASWGEIGTSLLQNAPALLQQSGAGLAQQAAERPVSMVAPVDSQSPLGAGVQIFEQYLARGADKLRSALGMEPAQGAAVAAKLYEDATADIQENAPNVDPDSLKGYAYDIATSGIQMIPAIAGTLATKRPMVGATVIAGQVGGTKYGESRAEGRTPEQAGQDATVFAAAEGIPEMIPLGILIRPGGKILTRMFKTAGAEFGQEMLTQAIQDGYDAGVLKEDMTWGQAMENMLRAGLIGAGTGAGVAAAVHPFIKNEAAGAPAADTQPAAPPAAGDAAAATAPTAGTGARPSPQAAAATSPLPDIGARVGLRREGGAPEAVVIEGIQDGYVFYRDGDGNQEAASEGDFRRDLTAAPPPKKPVDATTVPQPPQREGEPPPPDVGDINDFDPFGRGPASEATEAPPKPAPPAPQQAMPLPETEQIDTMRRAASQWQLQAAEAERYAATGASNAKTPEQIALMKAEAARLLDEAAELTKNITPRRESSDVTAASQEQMESRKLGPLGAAPVAQSEATTGPQQFEVTPPKAPPAPAQATLEPVARSEATEPQAAPAAPAAPAVPWQQRLRQRIAARSVRLTKPDLIASQLGVTPDEVTRELTAIAAQPKSPIRIMQGTVKIDKKTRQPVQSKFAGQFSYTPRPTGNVSESLSDFVRASGGIRPGRFAGEIEARDLQKARGKPGQRRLISETARMDLEEMANHAMQLGFMVPTEGGTVYGQEQARESVGSTSANLDRFLEMLDEDAHGTRKHYRLGDEPFEAAERPATKAERKASAIAKLKELGFEPKGTTVAEIEAELDAYLDVVGDMPVEDAPELHFVMEDETVARLSPEAQDAVRQEVGDDYPEDWYAQEIADRGPAAQPETAPGIPEGREPADPEARDEGGTPDRGARPAEAPAGPGEQVERALERIKREAASIAEGIAASKERAMIYQADEKERLAEQNGLPPDTYYNLPYNEWIAVQAAARQRTLKTETTPEGEQPVLIDVPKSAVQAQKARDAKRHGRMGTDVRQQEPGGMFEQPEPPDTRQTDIEDGLASPASDGRRVGVPRDLTENLRKLVSNLPGAQRLRAVHDWIVRNGTATGHEYGAGVTAGGRVIWAGTSDLPANLSFTRELTAALMQPGTPVNVFHNHPGHGGPLSGTDMQVAVYPNAGWIVAFDKSGRYSAARLSDAFRDATSHLTDKQRAELGLWAINNAKAASMAQHRPIFDAGKLTKSQFEVNDSAWRALGDTGIFDYRSDFDVPDYSIPITEKIRDQITERLEQHGIRIPTAVRVRRPAESVGTAAGLAEISGRIGAPAAADAVRAEAADGDAQGRLFEEEGRAFPDDRADAVPGDTEATGGVLARLTADESGAITIPEWNRIRSFFSKRNKTAKQVAAEGNSVNLGQPDTLRRIATVGPYVYNAAWLASMDKPSAGYFNALLDQQATRSTLETQAFEKAAPYFRLSKQDMRTVDALLEYYRLYGITPRKTGRNLVVRVPDRPPPFGDARPVLSKPGQILAADKAMTDAIFGLTDMFHDVWNNLHEAMARERGYKGAFTPEAIQQAIDGAQSTHERRTAETALEIHRNMTENARVGYTVPFQRYGDTWISVKAKAPEDGVETGRPVHFELVDTRSWFRQPFKSLRGGTSSQSFDQRMADLRRRFPAAKYNITHGIVQPDSASTLDIPALERALIAMNRVTNKKDADIVDGLLHQVYQQRMSGFRKQANNIPGYTTDFERAIADYVRQTSATIARLSHRDEVRSAFDATQHHGDPAVRKYWDNYTNYLEKEGGDLNSLRKVGFFLMMWGSPASALVDLTQTPLVTQFQLGTWAGPRASKLAHQAMLEAMMAVRPAKRHGLRVDLSLLGKTDGERRLLKEMADEGRLGPQISKEFQGGDLSNRAEAMRPHIKKMETIWEWGASMKNAAEEVNRVAAALASYRAAQNEQLRAKAMKVYADDQLFKEMVGRRPTPEAIARFFVDDSQFVAGKINRAPAMRGIGSLLFQFKNYPLNYLRLMHKNMTRMGKEGKVAGSLMLVSLLMFSGLLGAPFADDALKFGEFLYEQATGIDPMLEHTFRQWMGDEGWQQYAAELITRGVGRNLFGMDFGQRIGMGELFPTDSITDTMPLASAVLTRLSDVAERSERGQPLGAMAAFANFIGGKGGYDIARAAAQTQEGIKTKYGSTVIPAKDVTLGDVALRALGIQPTKVTRKTEQSFTASRAADATNLAKNRFTTRLATIMADAIAAREAGDDDKAKALQSQFNDELAEAARAFQESDEPRWHKMGLPQRQALRRRIISIIAPEISRLRASPKVTRPEVQRILNQEQ